jgi:PIN domain nuclease of toxin-antitoxin system
VANRQNQIWVSSATGWEISTKHRLGELTGIGSLAVNLFQEIQVEGFETVSMTFPHACLAGNFTQAHRDPFDRMLAAQSLLENLQLVSADPVFDQFGIERIWQPEDKPQMNPPSRKAMAGRLLMDPPSRPFVVSSKTYSQ